MSDLVRRLRGFAPELTDGIMTGPDHPNLQSELIRMNSARAMRIAADELERLTRELEEARKDQARLDWFFGPGDKTPFLDPYMLGVRQNYSIAQWRTAIDAAMSQEKRTDALDRMARDADELGLDF